MNLFQKTMLLAGALTLALILAALWTSSQIGDGVRIPMHWNTKGEIDGWAGKGGLWVIPGLVLFGILIFTIVPFLEPRLGRKLFESKAYCAIVLVSVLLLVCVQVGIISTALGKNFPMMTVIFSGVGLLFVVIGAFLGKIRRNLVMGIRTPWTLKSELSWKETHRLGGKLFVFFGFIILAVAWVPGSDSYIVWVLLGGVVPLVGVTSVYSWIIWKTDPERFGDGSGD